MTSRDKEAENKNLECCDHLSLRDFNLVSKQEVEKKKQISFSRQQIKKFPTCQHRSSHPMRVLIKTVNTKCQRAFVLSSYS